MKFLQPALIESGKQTLFGHFKSQYQDVKLSTEGDVVRFRLEKHGGHFPEGNFRYLSQENVVYVRTFIPEDYKVVGVHDCSAFKGVELEEKPLTSDVTPKLNNFV